MSKLLLIFTLAAAVIGGGYQFKDRLFPDRHTQAITRTLVAPSQSKAQTVPSALDYGVLNQALRRHVIEAEAASARLCPPSIG
ncbi:MAG: hypothetical protein KDK04_25405 [Candidatus Competibacteraceae bacterium]|nr:hypothetical protein [Candidatus Competibacteraceae bacterium]